MCGIAGIYSLTEKIHSQKVLVKMAKAIEHRGPDGEGFYHHKNVSLAHKRLSIIDVSDKGAQPMKSGQGNWVISFNGCIYNFPELKHELIGKGHIFISNSDTEVIVEGLEEEGTSFFERLNGMFAIAAYHVPSNRMFLSRDRFGVKPLYYWFDGSQIVFASEIKAIIAHPDYRVDIDYDALNEYFTFQNLFSYQSIFKGVVLLPPANTIELNSKSRDVKHASWWDYDFSDPIDSMTFEEAKEETKRLFECAVKKQMIADVPVGSYLSGGMDSGAITSIASSHVSRLKTFTCGFDMSEVTGVEANFDERRDAELMANHFKTEHYEQVMNAGDIKWSLPRVVYHLEELRVGMSYPNYYISRLASKFVKVCLQGTGGDELFGGYPWRYYRVFDSVSKEEYLDKYYEFWQRLVPEQEKEELFNFELTEEERTRPRRVFDNVFHFNKDLKYDTPEHMVQNSLYFEIKTFLPGLLMVGDKLAMASGLEERFPFLDNDLVDFAQTIPVKYKLENFEMEIEKMEEDAIGQVKKKLSYRLHDDGKSIFRKAMVGFIPERIINRQKQGFSAPDESWYRGENSDYVKELLLGIDLACSEYINQDYIRKIVNEHIEEGKNHRLLIWSFLNFEWWCKLFLNNEELPED
ncbi:MAG: asparagine synthase (glutamine-hydrolyzing) [Flavobacteriales bacterium]|nr:asparagine synthase (glutamine-hydrolyzing) [Flavobacteriales bacterium]